MAVKSFITFAPGSSFLKSSEERDDSELSKRSFSENDLTRKALPDPESSRKFHPDPELNQKSHPDPDLNQKSQPGANVIKLFFPVFYGLS